MVSLADLGLSSADLAGLDLELSVPGRVVEEQKHAYRVQTEDGPFWARIPGRMLHDAQEGGGRVALPAAGDFVLLRREEAASGDGWRLLERVLPRRTCLRRKAVGSGAAEQIIAANVDVVFIVNSLNLDLSIRRIERYLLAIWDSGALPVVLLSKGDLAADRGAALADVARVAMGAPVHVVSATSGEGVEVVRGYLPPGKTGALVGSSGVGKSTLINALLGNEALPTQAVRDGDDKGRHTTTHRSLWLLPGGGLIVDTPGMREFMPWSDDDGVAEVYGDVDEVAAGCRFSDCRHEEEPGCAVQAALASGVLGDGRLAAFRKASKEQAYLARKSDVRLAATERRKWKSISKLQRQRYREGK